MGDLCDSESGVYVYTPSSSPSLLLNGRSTKCVIIGLFAGSFLYSRLRRRFVSARENRFGNDNRTSANELRLFLTQ